MEQLPKIAQQRLAQQRADSDHPAADVLAGLIEHSLAEQERERVLAHLARCEDCRDVVALAMPESETPVADVRPDRRAWYEWSVFRFGGLIAALTVIVVAVVLFRSHGRPAQDAGATATSTASTDVISAAPGPPSSNAESNTKPAPALQDEGKTAFGLNRQDRDKLPPAFAKKEAPLPSEPERRGEKKLHLKSTTDGLALGTVNGKLSGPRQNERQTTTASAGKLYKDQSKGAAIGGGATAANVAVPAGPPPAATKATQGVRVEESAPQQNRPTQQDQSSQQPQTQQQDQRYDRYESNSAASQQASSQASPAAQGGPRETITVTAEAPVATAQAEVSSDNKLKKSPVMAQKAAPVPPKMIAGVTGAPVASTVRWTISATSTVQRSTDNGAHWQDVTIAEGAKFRTVATAGLEVWAGGSALYHSSDLGLVWQQVKIGKRKHPMEGEITSIALPSVARVELSTSAGQKWISEDSGRTWHLQ